MWPFLARAQDAPGDCAARFATAVSRPISWEDKGGYAWQTSGEVASAASLQRGQETDRTRLFMYSAGILSGSAGSDPAAPNRRFALKAATDAAHRQVEEAIESAGLLGDPSGYKRYLLATWRVRAQLEDQLDRNGAAGVWADWPGRRIAGLITQDLADLGLAVSRPPEGEKTPLSIGELLATMYVLEGSSLGARVLVGSVQPLGFSAVYGARHLHAQAGDAGAWRRFLSVLESAPVAPCHAAACAAFDMFAAAYAQAAN